MELVRISCRGRFGIVKVCVLASSSSGNCTFVGTSQTRVLIDAGLSRKETFARLRAIGEEPERLDAILVTHEHTDHVCGLLPLARKGRVPVYITSITAPTIGWEDCQPDVRQFQAGTGFTIGDIIVESFTIPHDAIDPVGYTLRTGGVKIGVATDLGYMPDSIRWHLRGSEFVVLESNHDIEMLKVGPYPWSVKQRVMGRRGHLSNDLACEFIAESLDSTTGILVLGHLSEQNNHPEIVRLVASQALDHRGLKTRLVVVEPRRQSEVFEL
ncbi:MAG: MBL fold metallo-hydrolase [Bryobacteraceae bacterium]